MEQGNNKKFRHFKRVAFTSNQLLIQLKLQPMAFKNKLDQKIELYFLYKKDGIKIKRGAGKKVDGQHVSEVKPKSSLELDTTGIGDDYELLAEMEKVPGRQGFRGVDFNPGISLGAVIDFQAFYRGHEYKVIARYKKIDDPLPGDDNDDEEGEGDPIVEYPSPDDNEDPIS